VLGSEGIGQRRQDGEIVHRQAAFGAQLAQPVDAFDGPVGGDQVADPAIVAGRAAQRDVAQAANIDRNVRRCGLHLQPRRRVELALELGPARRPQRLHQLEHLVGAPAAAVEPLTHQRELFLAPADADAELQPTTGEI